MYFKRTYGHGWGSKETVQTSQTSTSYPVLSVDTTTGNPYCFWGTSDIIYYKKRVNEKWDSTPTTWILEPKLIGETVTCFYQAWNAKIGVIWTQGNQSPYNVRFSYVNLPFAYRKLNLHTYMNDLVTPLSSAQVVMNNGSDQVKTVDSNGWANFTGITASSVTVKVKWQNSWVNETFTVTMESDKTINVRCSVYSPTFQVYKPDGSRFANAQLNIKFPNGTITRNMQCDSSGRRSFRQIQAGLYRLNVTTPEGFTAQTNFALDVSAIQAYDIDTTALKISEYDVDLSNAKVYIRLVFYNGASVSNGIINYASSEASTNHTGWATYTLTDLADIPYKSLAYGVRTPSGITYKWLNQTIPVAKTAHIILESDLTSIDHLEYDSTIYTLTIIGTGTGTKTITMRCEKPSTFKINGTAYEEGTKWTYDPSRRILTILDEWSTKTITITWTPQAQPITFNFYAILVVVAAISISILLIFYKKKR